MFDIRIKKIETEQDNYYYYPREIDLCLKSKETKDFIHNLSEYLNNQNCEDHPTVKSVIIIAIKDDKIIKIEKSCFCCQKFKDELNINTKIILVT